MATSQARFFLVAFAIMATAIIYNATFRQEGSHPAPMAGDGSRSSDTAPGEHHASPRAARTLPRQKAVSAPLPTDKNVLSIQRRLVEKGYEPGPADGVLGEQTRAAIIAYELDNALPVSGTASDRLLKAMILGVSPGETNSIAGQSMPDETTELIKSVQRTLANLGYEPGPIDGLIGLSTEKAIRKFETDRKITAKGRISGRLIKELKDASGGRLGVIASN